MDDLMVILYYVVWFTAPFIVGGLVAEYVLPRIPAVKRYLDRLSDWNGEREDEVGSGRDAKETHRHINDYRICRAECSRREKK